MSLGTMARHELVVAKQIEKIHKFTGMAIGGDLCEKCAYTLWRQGGRAPTRRRRGIVARRLSHKRDDLATLPRSFGPLSMHSCGCVYAFLAWGRCFAVQPQPAQLQCCYTATKSLVRSR